MAALLALLAAVGWGSSDYAAGSASRRSSAVSVVILTHLVAVFALLAVAVDLGPLWTTLVELARPDRDGPVTWRAPQVAGDPTLADIGWGLAAGLGGGLGAMLLFRGLGRGSMAVVAPITAAGAASVPVLLGVVTGESLAPTAMLGIGLALVAIVLVSLSADGPDAACGELTVPEEWTERYRDPDPGSFPSPQASGLVITGPNPGATATMAPMIAPAIAPATALAGAAGQEQRMLRAVTAAMMTLLLALVVAAAGMAAGPVIEISGGAAITAAHVVMLAFAALSMGIATFGLRLVRPLYALVGHPGRATDGSPDAGSATRVAWWRRALAQPGLPEALLSGIGFGTFYVFIGRASATAGHWPLVSARGLSVVMFTIAALLTSTAVLPARGTRRGVALAGTLDATAAVLFVLAANAGLLSIGAVLASLYPAVTVVLARVHGKERVARRQVVGLALALGAVVLLAV